MLAEARGAVCNSSAMVTAPDAERFADGLIKAGVETWRHHGLRTGRAIGVDIAAFLWLHYRSDLRAARPQSPDLKGYRAELPSLGRLPFWPIADIWRPSGSEPPGRLPRPSPPADCEKLPFLTRKFLSWH